jgi:RimJ/RimL family protein N-acetyltransferase
MDELLKKISFRLIQKSDLKLIHKWLLSDHVFQFYKDKNTKPTFTEVKNKYLPRVLGKSQTSSFLILFGKKPIGQIQMYKINDYPKYKSSIQINDKAAGVDLFIGEKAYLHKGLGSTIIRKFLKDYVFTQLDVDSCIMGPSPNNVAAIKAYQKAGLSHFKTIFDGKEDEYLMKIKKEAIMC